MNTVNYLVTRKKEYNQFLSTIYFLFNDLSYPISLPIPKEEFDIAAVHLIWEIFQEIEKGEHKKIENKSNQRIDKKSNQKIDKEIDEEFNKAFSHNENTNENTKEKIKYIPISKRKDPYENFLSNWKENLKNFNVSVLNQLPPDVLFEIINGLQQENKILNDKINSLIKSAQSRKILEQYIDDASKGISKSNSNKVDEDLIKEKYKENFDLLYQKLRQACIDLVNLQETGEIIYD